MRAPKGAIVRWFGTDTDIEDRKQGEKELHECKAEGAPLRQLLARTETSAADE